MSVDPQDIVSFLNKQKSIAKRQMHRYLVVLSGTRTWSVPIINALFPDPSNHDLIYVTDQNKTSDIVCESVKPSKLKKLLGQERDGIIWDGYSGMNPDGFGIATGLIRAGGFLIVLIPDADDFVSKPDPDYLRMCDSEALLDSCETHFLKRFITSIDRHAHCYLIREKEQTLNRARITEDLTVETVSLELPTSDQQRAIDAIIKTATARAHRPLVMTADRGRGKSSALGIAMRQLPESRHWNVIVTAPNRQACSEVFRHFESAPAAHVTMTFLPPDQLVMNAPDGDLLLVDEAAAIPAFVLEKLLSRYARIVFASTTHGYEGTGRGFAIRFQDQLAKQCPQWRRHTMSQPVRWAANDPLEDWVFDFLCLDADSPNKETSKQEICAIKTNKVEWIKDHDLATNETQLKQAFGLLVNAHYQTSPSDLRMLLDHPKIRMGCIKAADSLLGIILLLEEGGVQNQSLADGIIAGSRMPKHNLIPQSMTFASANTSVLEMSTFRVMRIAVHPDYQRQGLGSALLNATFQLAHLQAVDYLSSSFGLTPDLIEFWHRNQFSVSRLGKRKDAASGLESVIVTRPISARSEQTLADIQHQFRTDLIFGLSRYYRQIEAESIWKLFQSMPESGESQLTEVEMKKLHAYASSHRSLEDSLLVLHKWLIHSITNSSIESADRKLLVMKILQDKSWQTIVEELGFSGRGEAESSLRCAILKLI